MCSFIQQVFIKCLLCARHCSGTVYQSTKQRCLPLWTSCSSVCVLGTGTQTMNKKHNKLVTSQLHSCQKMTSSLGNKSGRGEGIWQRWERGSVVLTENTAFEQRLYRGEGVNQLIIGLDPTGRRSTRSLPEFPEHFLPLSEDWPGAFLIPSPGAFHHFPSAVLAFKPAQAS